jgi:DNA-binding transcriptional regulator/RsmH inhibitor MraZ
MLKKFEIWAKERWLEEIKRSEENFEGISEALAVLGI